MEPLTKHLSIREIIYSTLNEFSIREKDIEQFSLQFAPYFAQHFAHCTVRVCIVQSCKGFDTFLCCHPPLYMACVSLYVMLQSI